MNRFLAYVVTWAIFLAVFGLAIEGGLRLLNLGPKPTINEFHPKLGWVKTKNITAQRATSEFDVTYTINGLGLRDDDDLDLEKPEGMKRILFLGDSFTLGYTVDRSHLFVDLLGAKFEKEGRKIQVINGGTEGYSSDQELCWLREEGLKFDPDLVIMNFYQNDVFWNSRDRYLRIPKPRFPEKGEAEQPEQAKLEDPGKQGWFAASTALGKLLAGFAAPLPTFQTPAGTTIPMEWGVLLKEEPDFIQTAWNHTRAVMKGFKKTCKENGILPIVALIPAKAQIYQTFREEQGRRLGLGDDAWDPDKPFERMKEICRDIGLDTIDPTRLFIEQARENDGAGIPKLYFEKDRHFSPEGNRVFAQVLYTRLSRDSCLGKPKGASTPITLPDRPQGPTAAAGRGFPTWLIVVLCLWVVLGLLYVFNYRDENGFLAFLKVGALIGVVVCLMALINGLVSLPPRGSGGWSFGPIVLAIAVFLPWKLRKRIGLIFELYADCTNRGHWYMMPLLAVMLAIGSLLIVAASSPFVAPFIYTLF